jgi:hypothetical protein
VRSDGTQAHLAPDRTAAVSQDRPGFDLLSAAEQKLFAAAAGPGPVPDVIG